MHDLLSETDARKVLELHSILLDDVIDFAKNYKNYSKKEFSAHAARLGKVTAIANRQTNAIVKVSKIEYKKEEQKQESEPQTADLQLMARVLVNRGMVLLPPNNPNHEQDLVYKMVEPINQYENLNLRDLCQKLHEKEYGIKQYLKLVDRGEDPSKLNVNMYFESEEQRKNFPNTLREELKVYNEIRKILNFDLFPCSAYFADQGIIKPEFEHEYVTEYFKRNNQNYNTSQNNSDPPP